jgi:GlpG protein
MSGVNYALFGYIWIRGGRDPSFDLQLDQSTITILLIWFAICFTGLVGNIANTAHTMGLVIGAAWGWLAARRAR